MPTIHPLIQTHVTALKAIHLTNNYIALNHGDLAMFATLFFGILDPDSGALSYVNGGHEPIFVSSGPAAVLKNVLPPPVHRWASSRKSNLILGRSRLDPGDILVGYTDGVVEACALRR